jgi:hypothetical protein
MAEKLSSAIFDRLGIDNQGQLPSLEDLIAMLRNNAFPMKPKDETNFRDDPYQGSEEATRPQQEDPDAHLSDEINDDENGDEDDYDDGNDGSNYPPYG